MNLSIIPSDQIEEIISKSMLNSYANQFYKHFRLYKKSKDQEALHQLRVYSRRLSAVLNLLKNVIPVEKRKEWNKEIKRFLNSLNQPRDIDVQIVYLKNILKENDECQIISEEIIKHLQKQNHRLETKVVRAFKRIHNRKTVGDIIEFSAQPDERKHIQLTPPSSKILGIQCKKRLNPFLQKFTHYRNDIIDPHKVNELHECRLIMKKIRYTIEILKPFFPTIKKYLKIAEDLQSILGEIHDCDIWIEFLDSFPKTLSIKRNKYSKEESKHLLSELKKLRALRVEDRLVKHKQLVVFLDKNNSSVFEKQLLKSF
jgi:CHAD domain-containing protein